ncbi:hypothetical protein [Geodermatophilus sp. SYSU D01176]
MDEAAQRIIRRHWAIILVLTLVGLSVPFLMAKSAATEYQASARIIIGSADTRDGQEANALGDTALALASSPQVIGRALEQVGVRQDPVQVAEQVEVAPVGTSGVLELTVTDRDAEVAGMIVHALAAEVVRLREEVLLGNTHQLIAQTDEQIRAVTANISAIEAAAMEPFAPVESLALQHDAALEQRRVLEAQRQQLSTSLAQVVRPRVIDDSTAPGTPVPTSLPSRLAVGGLLGLILGVALAAVREAWWPTLGRTSLARQLGAPVLGTLRHAPSRGTELPDPLLTQYVTLAAQNAGVGTVQLVPVGPPVDVASLARSLDNSENGGPAVVPLALEASDHEDEMRPSRLPQSDAGIVVVAPEALRGSSLDALERHVQVTQEPILGIVTYRGRRMARHELTEFDDEAMALSRQAPSTPGL